MKNALIVFVLIFLFSLLGINLRKATIRSMISEVILAAKELKQQQISRQETLSIQLTESTRLNLDLFRLQSKSKSYQEEIAFSYESQSIEFKIDSSIRALNVAQFDELSLNEMDSMNKEINKLRVKYNTALRHFKGRYGFIDRIIYDSSSVPSFKYFDLQYGKTDIDPMVS